MMLDGLDSQIPSGTPPSWPPTKPDRGPPYPPQDLQQPIASFAQQLPAVMNSRRASLPLPHTDRDTQIQPGFNTNPQLQLENLRHNMLIEQQHKIAQLEDELRKARKEVRSILSNSIVPTQQIRLKICEHKTLAWNKRRQKLHRKRQV